MQAEAVAVGGATGNWTSTSLTSGSISTSTSPKLHKWQMIFSEKARLAVNLCAAMDATMMVWLGDGGLCLGGTALVY